MAPPLRHVKIISSSSQPNAVNIPTADAEMLNIESVPSSQHPERSVSFNRSLIQSTPNQKSCRWRTDIDASVLGDFPCTCALNLMTTEATAYTVYVTLRAALCIFRIHVCFLLVISIDTCFFNVCMEIALHVLFYHKYRYDIVHVHHLTIANCLVIASR